MNRGHRWQVLRLWVLVMGLSTALAAQAHVLAAVQLLREGGCGGTVPAAGPLRHTVLLDRAAEQWAAGHSLAASAERSGYAAESIAAVHVSGPAYSTLQLLRQSGCRTLADRGKREIGAYYHGADSWIVLANPYVLPSKAQAPQLATRALELVNDARAHGARCGARTFGPAPPVRLSGTLASVAFGHAADMAEHNYFEHEDRAGRTPADRVKAVGYQEKLVGENIAYGPKNAEEVVQGWLESPGHCENIMDPRFAEMGIAFAAGHAARRGLYWVQLLVAPKA